MIIRLGRIKQWAHLMGGRREMQMVGDDKNVQAVDAVPSKDWFLQFLVNMANKNTFELELTLTVGGFLISGTLSGVRRYFDDLGEYFAGPFDSARNSEEIKATFKKIGDQCTCVSPSEQTETPSYIHLKDARFYDAQGRSIPGRSGIWWRGRISEIQGFAPGSISR